MEQRYCSKCGAEIYSGEKYCSHCGTSIGRQGYRQSEIKGIFDYYRDALSKYAVFTGRSSLREYWHFFLANLIIGFVGGIALVLFSVLLGTMTRTAYVGVLFYFLIAGGYGLFMIIPSIAITVRRLHDQGKSGAWYFIVFVPYIGAIVIFVFMCLQGTPGYNQYGDSIE